MTELPIVLRNHITKSKNITSLPLAGMGFTAVIAIFYSVEKILSIKNSPPIDGELIFANVQPIVKAIIAF